MAQPSTMGSDVPSPDPDTLLIAINNLDEKFGELSQDLYNSELKWVVLSSDYEAVKSEIALFNELHGFVFPDNYQSIKIKESVICDLERTYSETKKAHESLAKIEQHADSVEGLRANLPVIGISLCEPVGFDETTVKPFYENFGAIVKKDVHRLHVLKKELEQHIRPVQESDETKSEFSEILESFFIDAITAPEPEFGAHDTKIMAKMIQDPEIADALPKHRKKGRTIFVTIGATAPFRALLEEVLSDAFLEKISGLGYDRLIMQCGVDYDWFKQTRPPPGPLSYNILIQGFDFYYDLSKYMMKCTPSDGIMDLGTKDIEKRGMGLIISHAGSGTILEALNFNTKVLVVANSTLMDDHQVELAKEFKDQGWVVHGKMGEIAQSVEYLETFTPKNWPPSPPKDSIYPGGLEDIVRDVVAGNLPPITKEQKLEDDARARYD